VNDEERRSSGADSTMLVGATDLKTMLEAGLLAAALLAFSALMTLVSLALHRAEREEMDGSTPDSPSRSSGDRS